MNNKALGYSSQVALVLSLIAGSVGTGNIWRFPRVVAANGGGAFIIAWVIMMIIVCLPIMLGEHVIGRTTRHGTPGDFGDENVAFKISGKFGKMQDDDVLFA